MRKRPEPSAQPSAQPFGAAQRRGLISTRVDQRQRRSMQLPGKGRGADISRSFSSPATRTEEDLNAETQRDRYTHRSFSSPEPIKGCRSDEGSKRGSETFYESQMGENSDSGSEYREQFEEFLDGDAELEDAMFGGGRRCEAPQRVMTSLLPGSKLQQVRVRGVPAPAPRNLGTVGTNEAADTKAATVKVATPRRLGLRALRVVLPTAAVSAPPAAADPLSSPELDRDAAQLEYELRAAGKQLGQCAGGGGVSVAEEESDTDADTSRRQQCWRLDLAAEEADAGRGAGDDATAAGDACPNGFRVRSAANSIRALIPLNAPRRSSRAHSAGDPAARTTETTRDHAICALADMGNVQCCASGRAPDGGKPKKQKKNKKGVISEEKSERNGDKSEPRLPVPVFADPVLDFSDKLAERAAAQAASVPGGPPAVDTTTVPQEARSESAATEEEKRSESVAEARQKFFGKVRSEESLSTPTDRSKFARWIPEFQLDGGSGVKHNGTSREMASIMENLKKNSLVRQNQAQVTSSSSQQMVSSSTTSSSSASSQRMQASSSQRLQHMTATDMKASSMKSDLNDLKTSISEMKNLSNSAAFTIGQRLRSSMENIVDKDELGERQLPDIRDLSDMGDIGDMADLGGESPLVTFPESDTPPPGDHPPPAPTLASAATAAATANELKYSAARVTSASSSRVVADGYSASRSAANSARLRRLQHGDLSYEEHSAAGARHRLLQAEGLAAEQKAAYIQEQRSLKSGEVSAQEANNMAASSSRIQTEAFSAENKAMASAQARQTVTSSGVYSSEKHSTMAHSNMTISSKNLSTSTMLSSAAQLSSLVNGTLKPGDEDLSNLSFDDLDKLCSNSNQRDVDMAIQKYSSRMDAFIRAIKNNQVDINKSSVHFNKLNEVVRRAWAVPTYGHELGYSLCNTLRTSGGLDILMNDCFDADNVDLQFSSAKLLEQCLTTENRAHVVQNGLDKVVKVACVCTKNANSVDHSRVGTGILEHLFKHSEGTCSDVIKLGGLDAVLFECRKNDVETLRHCAAALANLSLYGGAENQEAMIKRKVPMWLFPLAFHNDDNIKYYACLAIAVLVANKEIEAAVLKSGTLDLVEPFVTSHNPSEFARSNLAHAHGQSKNWLQRLVPVLSSKREEARNLAAFHFCMEAGIKKQQGNTEIFREIGAIESLKKVASCPNAVASKYAAQALRLIGEEVPHKLSQQVPLWSSEDVREWVKQIGFSEYATNFVESRVDGDLLLQLTEENLKEDIGLKNGIKRKRFTRELQILKKMADYSSRDTGSLNEFLGGIGPEYTIYTYSMLNAGVDKDSIRGLSDEQLENECGIVNGIHRLRILNAIKVYENSLPSSSEETPDKSLDVFVSYRRSNGSQLASLLKVHLQLRGFTVFIDVERLEAGKFDNNLLQSIRQAKHFLLVLTPAALDRCKHDDEQKDWVHREIVAALQSDCNIIPIIDNFEWPDAEELPEDMRPVCHFNGVRWIHDYQDACVEKLERFLRGELNARAEGALGRMLGKDAMVTPGTAQVGRGPPSYQRMASCESRGSDKAD